MPHRQRHGHPARQVTPRERDAKLHENQTIILESDQALDWIQYFWSIFDVKHGVESGFLP